jgi:phage tail-like protein
MATSPKTSTTQLFYPPVGFYYQVLVDGISGVNEGNFAEVSGINVSMQTEEIKEGGENRFVHQLPLRPVYERLVLKRGLVTSSPLIIWVSKAVQYFLFTPKTVSVNLLDANGDVLVTWTFTGAYPVAAKMSNLNAQENSVFFETIELAYSYFTRK